MMTVNEPGDQTKYIAKLADLVELVEEHNLWDLIDMPKLFEDALNDPTGSGGPIFALVNAVQKYKPIKKKK